MSIDITPGRSAPVPDGGRPAREEFWHRAWFQDALLVATTVTGLGLAGATLAVPGGWATAFAVGVVAGSWRQPRLAGRVAAAVTGWTCLTAVAFALVLAGWEVLAREVFAPRMPRGGGNCIDTAAAMCPDEPFWTAEALMVATGVLTLVLLAVLAWLAFTRGPLLRERPVRVGLLRGGAMALAGLLLGLLLAAAFQVHPAAAGAPPGGEGSAGSGGPGRCPVVLMAEPGPDGQWTRSRQRVCVD